jgi:acyl carrier protein
VLNVESIGVNENFFDLGAHSLTVVEVHAKLQNRLNREIPLVDLFQYSSVESLAQHLAGTSSQIRTTDRAQRRRMARNHSA